MMRAGIAMAALIDDEGAAEMADVELVGAEQIDEIDLALLRAVDDARHIAAALARHEAEIERRRRGCAAVCRTLKPFQPPSAALPAGPIMPVSPAIFAASARIAAPSARVSAPAPRMIIGRLASFSIFAKSWLPSAMPSSASTSAPSCSTG